MNHCKIPIELAQEIGISRQYLFKINQGVKQPSYEVCRRIILAMEGRGYYLGIRDLNPQLVMEAEKILQMADGKRI